MKFVIYSIVLLSIVSILKECENDKNKNLAHAYIYTYSNNNPIINADISIFTISGVKNQEATNQFGRAKFIVALEDIGREVYIEIKHEAYKIDTSFYLGLEDKLEIQLFSQELEKFDQIDKNYPDIDDGKIKLESIDKELDKVAKMIDTIERQLEDYLQQYPNSTLKTYVKILKHSKENWEKLKALLSDVLQDHLSALDSMQRNNLTDIERLRQSRETTEQSIANFIDRYKKTHTTISKVLNAQPDNQLQIGILFDPGKFRLKDMDHEQKDSLNRYVFQVKNTIKYLHKQKIENLHLELRIVGHTDGTQVFPNERQYVKNNCKHVPEYANKQDANYCLSYLRAEAIGSYVIDNLPDDIPLNIDKEFIGKGREEAPLNDNSPRYRKCEVSFSVFSLSE